LENLKRRDLLGVPVVDGRIILKWSQKKLDVKIFNISQKPLVDCYEHGPNCSAWAP
jgi:hypothetical protein